MTGDRIISSDSEVFLLAFTADGKSLAGCCRDMGVRFWNVATGNLERKVVIPQGTGAPFLSADGRYVAGTSPDKTVKIWDLRNGEIRNRVEGFTMRPGSLAISPDGKFLATNADRENTVQLYDLPSSKRLWTTPDGVGGSDLIFSPNGNLLVGANSDANLRVWDARSGKLVKLLDETPVTMFGLEFSPDGKLFAAAGANRVVYLWDTTTWALQKKLAGQPEMVATLTFSPNGRYLLTGGFDDVTVKNPTRVLIWDVAAGTILRKLDAAHRVGSVAFSRDSGLAAVTVGEKSIALWAVPAA